MISPQPTETWDLWYPGAAATGLPFARGRLDPTEVLWVHSAPKKLDVTVRRFDGSVRARGQVTREAGYLPMTRLALDDGNLVREDRWPIAVSDLNDDVDYFCFTRDPNDTPESRASGRGRRWTTT